MAYIGQDPVIGRYILVDQISGGFNGTASGFTLAAGGQGVIPGLAQNVLLSLGGVIQQPGTDYTVSGSGITFTTPPLSGTTFFATVLGDVQAVGTPSDGTVLPASIATSGTFVFPNITTTGTTLIASGNASTPSLAVIGDTNTGLYSPGADQLAISTGGSGRLFVDASGNIGINTASPQNYGAGYTPLTIDASTSPSIELRVAGTRYGRIYASTSSLNLDTWAATPMIFGINTAEKMRLTSTGLGVGTSSPVGNFHVSSSNAYFTSIDLENTASTGRRYTLFSTTSLSGIGGPGLHVYDATASASRLFIDSSGRVGIGTSVPGAPFETAASSSAGVATVARFRHDNGGDQHYLDITVNPDTNTVNLVSTGSANGGITLGTPAVTALTTDSSGRVGIGTTSPVSLLHVNAATGITYATIGNGSGGTQIGVDASGLSVVSTYAANAIRFGNSSGSTFVETARLDSSGRLLVGTSSARSNFLNSSTFTSLFQVEGSGGGASRGVASLVNSSAGGDPPWLLLGFSRNGSVGGNTIVENNDNCGLLAFGGNDGSEFVNAAYITAEIDGTPGANDMPGRLIFATTADGASSPTERFRISSTGAQSSVIPGGSTLYPQFACRAWVNFNGTGTVAIRASGNVSSITDNGTGDYTVNFTTAMADANSSVVVTAQRMDTTSFEAIYSGIRTNTSSNITASSARVYTALSTTAAFDSAQVCVAIFR